MAPVGETNRTGGRVDAAYAQRLLTRLQAGKKLSLEEQAALRRAMSSPEFRDRFSAEAKASLEQFVRGGDGPRDVEHLLPQMSRLERIEEVSRRFGADFSALREQIIDGRNFTSQDKATRAIEYFAAYAQRFVELSRTPPPPQQPQRAPVAAEVGTGLSGDEEATIPEGRPRDEETRTERSSTRVAARSAKEVTPGSAADSSAHAHAQAQGQGPGVFKLPGEKLKAEIQAFLDILREHGFGQIQETTTGKDGLRIAHEMLKARTPVEVFRLLEGKAFIALGFPVHAGELTFNGDRLNVPHDALRDASEAAVVRAKAAGEQAPLRLNERDAAMRIPGLLHDGPQAPSTLPDGTTPSQRGLEAERSSRGHRRRYTNKRLGAQLLWNVLHRLRGEGEDSVLSQDAWDKITVAALLILLFVALVVVLIVNL